MVTHGDIFGGHIGTFTLNANAKKLYFSKILQKVKIFFQSPIRFETSMPPNVHILPPSFPVETYI
jgi:hypothetical protein